jgi:hypothetical protein
VVPTCPPLNEDRDGHLVVDAPLLAFALQWAEHIDPEQQGVSITRFKSGIGLPTKAHSFQLRDALRIHGLIRRELKKEGWYRLLTVEEAVRAGKLPPGPWYVPAVEEGLRAPAAGGQPIAVPAPVDATPGVPAPARRGAVVTADAVEAPV